MSDIEDRLRAALNELAETVPEEPSSSWSQSKDLSASSESGSYELLEGKTRCRHKRSAPGLAAVIVLAAGGIGVGVAAAAGAFSPAADHEFKQFAARSDLLGGSGASGLPQQTVPITSIHAPTPNNEILEVTDPGPDGSTISVWEWAPTNGVTCFASVVNESGSPVFPGKPSNPGGGCGGWPDASAPANVSQGGGASIWRSRSGVLYMIMTSSVVPGTTKVSLSFANGDAETPAIENGWFALSVPYDQWIGGFTQTEYNNAGVAIYTMKKPADQ